MNNKLYVAFESRSYGGDIINPEDRWSCRTDEHHEITVTGLYKNHPDSLHLREVKAYCDTQTGDRVYLLVVRHSSGDSFGTSYGHACFEGVYSSLKEAEEVATSIRDDSYVSKNKFGYKPWSGYFSGLEDIEIHSMIVKDISGDKLPMNPPFKVITHD